MSRLTDEMRKIEEEQRAARLELFRTAVAAGVVQEQTVTREIQIEPIDERGLRFTRVKLSRTTFLASVDPDDTEPFDDARGWAHTLTAKGEVSKRDTPGWRHLPADLVALLIDTLA